MRLTKKVREIGRHAVDEKLCFTFFILSEKVSIGAIAG